MRTRGSVVGQVSEAGESELKFPRHSLTRPRSSDVSTFQNGGRASSGLDSAQVRIFSILAVFWWTEGGVMGLSELVKT